jgi:hypothetical protein
MSQWNVFYYLNEMKITIRMERRETNYLATIVINLFCAQRCTKHENNNALHLTCKQHQILSRLLMYQGLLACWHDRRACGGTQVSREKKKQRIGTISTQLSLGAFICRLSVTATITCVLGVACCCSGSE